MSQGNVSFSPFFRAAWLGKRSSTSDVRVITGIVPKIQSPRDDPSYADDAKENE